MIIYYLSPRRLGPEPATRVIREHQLEIVPVSPSEGAPLAYWRCETCNVSGNLGTLAEVEASAAEHVGRATERRVTQ